MSHTLFLTILYIFSKFQECCQAENIKTGNTEDESEQENLIKDIQNEGFLMVNDNYFQENDFFEGSGLDPLDWKNCIEEGYNSVCSNRGKCIDNRCICQSETFYLENATISYGYTGRYCEECQFCRPQRCERYLPCIECNIFQQQSDCNSYCQFQYKIVDKITRNFDSDEKFCDIESSGCYFKFKYYFDSRNLVFAEFEKDSLCFNGSKIVLFTFWGVVIYIFALILLVPRLCPLDRVKIKVTKSATSLAARYDTVRFNNDES